MISTPPALYTPEGLQAFRTRLDKLRPDSARQWGKMDPAQMLTHLRLPFEVATGKHTLPPMWIMKIFGPVIRKALLSDKPVKKNSPTAASFVITDQRDFEHEKSLLLTAVEEFIALGKEDRLPPRHPYFGKMNKEEWNAMQWKHSDHHFTQFGV